MFEIVFHPLFNELHELGEPKPVFETYESPMRTRVIWEYFTAQNYIASEFPDEPYVENEKLGLSLRKPLPLNKSDVLRVHSPYLYELVEHLSSVGYGEIGNMVQATNESLEIALLSAGGAYQAIKDVYTGVASQSSGLIRPPGHHAIRDESNGLCIFNNIALAIEKLRKDNTFQGRIAIIDIDTHYGDGLAKTYYENPDILYASIHEYVPGEAGIISEIGAGAGKGYNICYPVPLEADDRYLRGFTDLLTTYLEKYQPELLVVALGLDGHWADPIGNLRYTSKGYNKFAKWLHRIADKVCGGKIALILEGGYNLAVLPCLAGIFLSEFAVNIDLIECDSHMSTFFKAQQTSSSEIKKYNELIKKQLRKYWT
ncbi:MAG: histone deacetylase [Candidatus Lokiarchaeota archaeon]|nr:histone deacetylase [Candidatus Lokiarchaeota archaeon]